jgi:glycerol-3-phosphate dehydrogenase
MRRATTQELSGNEYDVLVVGAGAAGAAAAREASLRGLRTALIEREDFGSGTSAHCFKVVHGGIRYLQHADIRRIRDSAHERSVLLRLAPHLVQPMPFAVPTYGWGRNARWFLGAGMLTYDAVTFDRNRGLRDSSRRIAGTRFLNRDETLRLFPGIEQSGLTGAAIFEDGQMHSPPRLTLAFVAAAESCGACVANYVEAEQLLVEGARVRGVWARDRLSGERFEIRARMVINAAGAWAEGLLATLRPRVAGVAPAYSRDACFAISRSPPPMALALQAQARDADALLSRGVRHLFLMPWRGCTLVGVWHRVVKRDPEAAALSREELRQFVQEVNSGFPSFELDQAEVQRVDFGLVPFGEAGRQGNGAISFGKQSHIIDHSRRDAVSGLITVISVRYTVGRRDAVAALDLAAGQLGMRTSAPQSETQPLPGGDIANFADFLNDFQRRRPEWLSIPAAGALARNFGSRAGQVLSLADADSSLRRCFHGTAVTYAEVAHSVREEMAVSMSDVVFRRTELGTAGHPGDLALGELQAFLQQELGWSARRTAEERNAVHEQFQRYLASPEPLRRIA